MAFVPDTSRHMLTSADGTAGRRIDPCNSVTFVRPWRAATGCFTAVVSQTERDDLKGRNKRCRLPHAPPDAIGPSVRLRDA